MDTLPKEGVQALTSVARGRREYGRRTCIALRDEPLLFLGGKAFRGRECFSWVFRAAYGSVFIYRFHLSLCKLELGVCIFFSKMEILASLIILLK